MKRKNIELKEFEYKTPHELGLMMKSQHYSGLLVLEDKWGSIFQAELCEEDGHFSFVKPGEDMDYGIDPDDIVFIEEKGLL